MTVKDVIARLECLSGDSEVYLAVRKSGVPAAPNRVRTVTVATMAAVRESTTGVQRIVLLTDEGELG